MAPIGRYRIVAGMLLARVAIGWIQAGYMLLLGIVLFKIRWAEHSWTLFGFLTLLALCAASLGMLIGTFFRDPDKAEAMAVWSGILLAPLGGLWWPLEVVGPTMRKIGHMVPTGWAMEGVNALLAFGDGPLEVAPYAAAFFGLTIVALYFVARRLRP
jgi:ABC-2 type transport system permease protein